MDRFEELETFTSVVEAGSFTAAATRLDIAKSAVSRRIADLEARLGVQLFRRTTRRLHLTDSGRGLYERAKRLLEDLAETEARVAQEHHELRGRLRAALPMSFGLRHLSPAICEFSAANEGIHFELDFNDRRVDLLQEGFDLAIRIGRMDDSSLIARRLFDARTVVCASPEYLSRRDAPRNPAELVDHDVLVYSNAPDPEKWTWRDADGARHAIQLTPKLSANSGEYLCDAAAAGIGITLQPTFIVHKLISAGALVPLLTAFQWPVSTGYAVYPPTRHLSQRVRRFIDFLVDRFDGVPYWDADIETALRE